MECLYQVFISGQCLNDVKRAINLLYHLLVVMLRFIGPPPRALRALGCRVYKPATSLLEVI